jgi:hypothetical protein
MTELICKPYLEGLEPLLNTEEAARVLSTTNLSLKQSRYTGFLYGKPAPKFIKLGRSARYKPSELLRFREQFSEYQNTSEIPVSRVVKK